jgi:hypothetical protein
METYFIIYKTTCLETNKYYVGMHKTNNLQDGYLGSGKLLKRSLNKYGKENHVFEILEYLNDLESLIKRETEIVNETLLSDKMCMNLKVGGTGGFMNEEHRKKAQAAGGRAMVKIAIKARLDKLKNDTEFKKNWIENLSKSGMSNPMRKKVAKIDPITGEIIETFDSAKQAEKEYKLHKVHDVCLGYRKTCGGYIWKYI